MEAIAAREDMDMISASSNVPVNLPNDLRRSAIDRWPTMHDLPSENPLESGLPDEFHGVQPQLLAETINLMGYGLNQIFYAFDLNLYYDPEHTGWYKRPDWFLVVGTDSLYRGRESRSSYVMWDELIPPTIVIEFLSPGTESDDLGRFASKPPNAEPGKPPGKFVVYEQILKVPNYIIYNETTQQMRYFRLVNGRYRERTITSDRIWIPELKIGLGLWTGTYRHRVRQRWLRWCDIDGNWTLTETEQERSQKEFEKAEKEKLLRYLRSIGVDPNNLGDF